MVLDTCLACTRSRVSHAGVHVRDSGARGDERNNSIPSALRGQASHLDEPYCDTLSPRTLDHVLSEVFGFFRLQCVEEGFEHMPVDGKMELLDGYDTEVKVSSNECFKTQDDPKLYDCEVYVKKPDRKSIAKTTELDHHV
ncbi:hypothetical protein DOTSEDRAFT_38980 [Dothistroma septosporum NZE10]|uniref:Uncharacterized protein n=1 Tax=Dothistroma septosporum (strain NZE10 / CBS 128990) TaxID=675120 RepID=M2WID0_DOTSN|nr:hypothetical protein DOTSEDRAFT_38980 [Dothistroma septosporum NZE10]